MQRALAELEKAQARLTASGIGLLEVAHILGRTAVDKMKDSFVKSLVEDKILQDLARLQTMAETIGADDQLGLLPKAILNWLSRNLDVHQYLEADQELEIPAERMSNFEVANPEAVSTKSIQIVVDSPGWKHHGKTILAPRVRCKVENKDQMSALGPE